MGCADMPWRVNSRYLERTVRPRRPRELCRDLVSMISWRTAHSKEDWNVPYPKDFPGVRGMCRICVILALIIVGCKHHPSETSNGTALVRCFFYRGLGLPDWMLVSETRGPSRA